MDKMIWISFAGMMGKAMAAGFYMEIERRLGKTRFGSVLGFLGFILIALKSLFIKKKDKNL